MPAADRAASRCARRILIYGVTGSGKSVAAQRISERLGIAYHLADELTWGPNWTPVDGDEQRRRITEIVRRDSWILDTAYSGWLEDVVSRAELIVGLDYPRWFSLQRLLRRTVARIVDKRPICNGNVETARQALGRNSIVVWHFRSFARKRDRMRAWRDAVGGPPVLLFSRSADLDTWIGSLGDTDARRA